MKAALGVVQMADERRARGQRRQGDRDGPRRCRREARRSCCCRSCSRGTTGRRRSARRSSSARIRSKAIRSSRRFQALAQELRRRSAALVLREGRTRALQQPRDDRRDAAKLLGLYRKSHIPDGPGYMEKYYFTPGDTGFKAFRTASGTVGAAICWDQWYPEAARAMALQGAEVLLYPTAIGSEPEAAGEMDTSRDVAARDDRPRGGQRLLSGRSQSRRHRARGRARAERSTAAASSPTTPATRSPKRIGPRRPCWSRRSIWIARAASAPAWDSSGTVGPISTRRCSRRTAGRRAEGLRRNVGATSVAALRLLLSRRAEL